MKRLHLNLTAEAWCNLRRAWHPPLTPTILWQSFVAGPVLSAADKAQVRATAELRRGVKLDGALVILGYWRSGTTLLHELLAASGAWAVPTTHACMNPQSFAIAGPVPNAAASVRRPMDAMVISANSPQEDEFALLGLGARSPYEALLFPDRLAAALRLSDPDFLSPEERRRWMDTFRGFVANVAITQGNKPLLLKSPPHACRIALLRQVLPGSRFVVIVRNPYEVFESSVHMWHQLFALYGLTRTPPDDVIREAVLGSRPGFDKKLQAGIESLAADEFAFIRFEDLIARPGTAIAGIYRTLHLNGGEAAASAAAQEAALRKHYTAHATQPAQVWREKIRERWADVFARYDYPV